VSKSNFKIAKLKRKGKHDEFRLFNPLSQTKHKISFGMKKSANYITKLAQLKQIRTFKIISLDVNAKG